MYVNYGSYVRVNGALTGKSAPSICERAVGWHLAADVPIAAMSVAEVAYSSSQTLVNFRSYCAALHNIVLVKPTSTISTEIVTLRIKTYNLVWMGGKLDYT